MELNRELPLTLFPGKKSHTNFSISVSEELNSRSMNEISSGFENSQDSSALYLLWKCINLRFCKSVLRYTQTISCLCRDCSAVIRQDNHVKTVCVWERDRTEERVFTGAVSGRCSVYNKDLLGDKVSVRDGERRGKPLLSLSLCVKWRAGIGLPDGLSTAVLTPALSDWGVHDGHGLQPFSLQPWPFHLWHKH